MSPAFAAAQEGKREVRAGGLWQEVRNVPAESRMDLTWGRGETIFGTVGLWWATKSEWEGLIDVAGFEIEALYGGFAREPFDEAALEYVWVARKP
jgi:hypothetical protein